MTGQQVVTCKKCGSNKVQEFNGMRLAFIFMGFMMFGLGVWIPLIGWLLMMPAGLIMIVVGVLFLFKKKKTSRFQCVECKHSFQVSKEDQQEFRNAIN